jgi:16S rRNA (cytosine967-C5)-methyltransferase
MRILYRPLWEGVQIALRDIFAGGFPADKVIQRQLKQNRKWGSHDRRLFAESVYDLVRWWRRLLVAAEVPWPTEDSWTSGEPEVIARVLETWCLIQGIEIDRSVARLGLKLEVVKGGWENPNMTRAERESLPDWMDQWGFEQLGAKWDAILPTLNTQAPVYLRANALRTTPQKLVEVLAREKIESELAGKFGVRLKKRANVFLLDAFKQGLFEVQDLSSQQVAAELLVEPGQRVIDACAGAGGKTLHLAALMQGKGKIIALDIVDKKLEQLRERAVRNGVSCIEARWIDSSKVIKRLAGSADRVLIDAPCSGLGVLRRNPDSKWKKTAGEMRELEKTQASILTSYSEMCKPGGFIVYATCSILPAENERQVQHFLSQNETRWTCEREVMLWPEKDGGDGFYLARLRRN